MEAFLPLVEKRFFIKFYSPLFLCLRFGVAKTSLVLSAQTSLRGSATSLLREQKFAKAKTSPAERCISQDNGNEQKFPPHQAFPH